MVFRLNIQFGLICNKNIKNDKNRWSKPDNYSIKHFDSKIITVYLLQSILAKYKKNVKNRQTTQFLKK